MLRSIVKALFFTVEPVRCDECYRLRLSFNCPVLHWNEVILCRKCANKILEDTGYYSSFSPVRDFIVHFRYSLQWVGAQF